VWLIYKRLGGLFLGSESTICVPLKKITAVNRVENMERRVDPLGRKLVIYIVALWCCIFVDHTAGRANLDAAEPIVKVSPVGEAVDEFGYSVLLHQVFLPRTGNFESFLDSTR